MSSYFLSKGLTKQWFDLEYALERKIALPMSLVCGYNIIIPGLWDIDILRYYKKINEENKEYVDAHTFECMHPNIRIKYLQYNNNLSFFNKF